MTHTKLKNVTACALRQQNKNGTQKNGTNKPPFLVIFISIGRFPFSLSCRINRKWEDILPMREIIFDGCHRDQYPHWKIVPLSVLVASENVWIHPNPFGNNKVFWNLYYQWHRWTGWLQRMDHRNGDANSNKDLTVVLSPHHAIWNWKKSCAFSYNGIKPAPTLTIIKGHIFVGLKTNVR